MDRKNTRTKPEKMQLDPVDCKNKERKLVAKEGRWWEIFFQKGRCVAHLNVNGCEICTFLQTLVAMILQR